MYMNRKKPAKDVSAAIQEILGFLNYSSGATDPRFLANVNKLFGWLAAGSAPKEPTWQALGMVLLAELQAVRGKSDAFQKTEQAEAVLRLTFD
jgi:hypothetical protein